MASFDRELVVLVRPGPLASGPVAVASNFVLAMFFAIPIGLFVNPRLGSLVGAGVAIGMMRSRPERWLALDARPERARVVVTEHGVTVDQGYLLRREEIADGYLEAVRPGGIAENVSLRLVDDRSRIRFEAETPRAVAEELLATLGLEAGDRSVEFLATPLPYATRARVAAFVVVTVIALLFTGIGRIPEAAFAPWAILLAALAMVPTRIRIDARGLSVRWLGLGKEIPRSDIAAFAPKDEGVIRLRLRSGGEHLVCVAASARPGVETTFARHQRDRVLARLRASLGVRQPPVPAPPAPLAQAV